MGFINKIRSIFKKDRITQSLNQSNHSLTHSITQSIESINHSPTKEEIAPDKTALELGLAAGVAGQTIRFIESSLQRIESLMTTKDWMELKLSEFAKAHEEAEEKRFQTLVSLINSLHHVAEKSPEPIKEEILSISTKLEKQSNLTPRMQRFIQAIKEVGEISYADLAKKLGMSEDGIRGLASIVLRKTNVVEKVHHDKKVWLKYTGHPDVTESLERINQSLDQSENLL